MTGGRVLETTDRRLTRLVAGEQASGRLPTLVAGVVRDGALVWSTARGSFVDQSGVDPPSSRTQYRIGSITKTFTALLVMQLRDEGLLGLSDRLDVHLPGIAYGDRTLRQLMAHLSGMPAEPPGSWWERSPGVSFDVLAERLDGAVTALPVEEQYHYSNVAYALLGEVVARRAGQPWFDALRSRLLDPLGLQRTTYSALPPAADGFSVHTFAGTLTDEPTHDSMAMAPAGQLWSTIEDLARYAAFLVDPDPAVISPETVREMTVMHAGSPEDVLAGAYALGFQVAVVESRTYIGHTGSVPGFVAGMYLDRARKTAAVCLANGGYGLRAQGLPIDLLRLLEESEPAVPSAWTPTTAVPAPLLDLLGLWHWGNMPFTISYDDPGLVFRLLANQAPWCTFRPEGDDRFVGTTGYYTGEPLQAVRRTNGSISHLVCATFIFTRVPYDPEAPIPGG